MNSRSFCILGLGMFLGGCAGSSSEVSSDSSLVGAWAHTKTTTLAGSSVVDERYWVFGTDKTARALVRTTNKYASGATATTTWLCASGTYVLANGVLSWTMETKRWGPNWSIVTETGANTSKVEFIDATMRVTADVNGSPSVSVFQEATLPDGIEAGCPK